MIAVGASPESSPRLGRSTRRAELHVPYVCVRVGMSRNRIGRASLRASSPDAGPGILRFSLQRDLTPGQHSRRRTDRGLAEGTGGGSQTEA